MGDRKGYIEKPLPLPQSLYGWMDARSLVRWRHNQIFLAWWVTNFAYPWCFAGASPRVCTDGRTFAGSYSDVITKFSRLDGLPILLTHGALLACFARLSSATIVYVMVSLYFHFYEFFLNQFTFLKLDLIFKLGERFSNQIEIFKPVYLSTI